MASRDGWWKMEISASGPRRNGDHRDIAQRDEDMKVEAVGLSFHRTTPQSPLFIFFSVVET